MNNLIVRGLLAWFNDGKRITAVIVTLLQLLAPFAAAHGLPIPEALVNSVAGYVASAVLVTLSKADVRIEPSAPLLPKK